MPSHSPGLQEQGNLLIRSTFMHGSPNTGFFSFFLFSFFLLKYLLHRDLITDCFANVFLPAQAVFSWLRMLALVSYRWGWPSCTSNEWLRLSGGVGDCWDLLYTQHVSLCYWWYLLLVCFPCPGASWLKQLISSLSLVLCLWLKIHALADKLHLVKCALKVTEVLSWTTALPSSLSGYPSTISPNHKPSFLQLALH